MKKPTKPDTKVNLAVADEVYDLELINELQEGLLIDKNALDDALLEQPNMFYHVSERLSLWTSRRDAAKQQQQLVEAKVDASIRHNAEVAEEKITEREVESQKRVDKDVRAAQDDLLRFNHTVNRFANLKEAYLQRGYVLRELCALHLANYYASNIGNDAGNSIKDQRAMAAREAMSRERRRAQQEENVKDRGA